MRRAGAWISKCMGEDRMVQTRLMPSGCFGFAMYPKQIYVVSRSTDTDPSRQHRHLPDLDESISG